MLMSEEINKFSHDRVRSENHPVKFTTHVEYYLKIQNCVEKPLIANFHLVSFFDFPNLFLLLILFTMKTALLFIAASVCIRAHAQLPYFLQEHSLNNLGYGIPVDIEYDLNNTIFSLHSTNPGPGVLITQYDATVGNVLSVTNLTRGNSAMKPVRVRTFGGNYYVLFNFMTGGGISSYCLVNINAANVVVWSQSYVPPAGGAPRVATDFTIDGSQYAYIVSNAYDATNNQNDIAVTKVDLLPAVPVLVWDNVYQNISISRDETSSNIVYRAATNELAISAISVNPTNPVIDRGPMILRVGVGGTYNGSMLYEYVTGCNHAEPVGTWIMPGPSNFYLSSTSTDNGSNGPLWLAKINPSTLAINIQTNHPTGTAYLGPEMNPVFSTTGSEVLVSGSSTAASGYLHLHFTTSALSFIQGEVYPVTSPQTGSPMYDIYKTTGTGLNIFSVAEDPTMVNNYYLLKTDDNGHNDCEQPYTVSPDHCTMTAMPISFTQVPVATTVVAPVCTTTARSNSFVQFCDVHMKKPNVYATKNLDIDPEVSTFPNPTQGIVNISAGKSTLSDIHVFNIDGKEVLAEKHETAEGIQIDLTGKKPGIYMIQLLIDGERKNVRIVLE